MLTKAKSSNLLLTKYFFIVPVCLLSMIYVACNKESLDLSKKETITKNLNSKTGYSNWQATDYKTGDTPSCLEVNPSFDYKMDNQLLIKNDDENTDAIVKLIYLKNHEQENSKEITVRIAFIKGGDAHSMKNIPKGKYYLKIAYGNSWKELIKDNNCTGRFTLNPQYEKGDDVVDFTPIRTSEGFEVPSYEITLDTERYSN